MLISFIKHHVLNQHKQEVTRNHANNISRYIDYRESTMVRITQQRYDIPDLAHTFNTFKMPGHDLAGSNISALVWDGLSEYWQLF